MYTHKKTNLVLRAEEKFKYFRHGYWKSHHQTIKEIINRACPTCREAISIDQMSRRKNYRSLSFPSPVEVTIVLSFSFHCTLKSMHLSWAIYSCFALHNCKMDGHGVGALRKHSFEGHPFQGLRVWLPFLYWLPRIEEHRAQEVPEKLTLVSPLHEIELGVKHALWSQFLSRYHAPD